MKHHHHILIINPNRYTNIEDHILRSNMNSIHERHVSSQEKPRSMSHTFLKIIRWRNNRQTKRNSRSYHHISLVIKFPTNQEFCNSDSAWESYANFSEDAKTFLLHKISHFSPRVVKFQRENWLMNKWNVWYYIYIGHGGNLMTGNQGCVPIWLVVS